MLRKRRPHGRGEGEGGSGSFMRAVALILALALTMPLGPVKAQSCVDDYLTIETIIGTIIDIQLAPEPFRSADIFIKGPAPCDRMWMQVLKMDADRCRIGDRVEAMGVVTSDPENNAWQINPVRNEYMLLGADFMCHS
jgi:hypothetical protein